MEPCLDSEGSRYRGPPTGSLPSHLQQSCLHHHPIYLCSPTPTTSHTLLPKGPAWEHIEQGTGVAWLFTNANSSLSPQSWALPLSAARVPWCIEQTLPEPLNCVGCCSDCHMQANCHQVSNMPQRLPSRVILHNNYGVFSPVKWVNSLSGLL